MTVVKVSEIKASSPLSFEDAVKEGISRASKTIRNIKSAWVKEFEVKVDDNGKISEFRVLMKLTFILEG
jgi:dodecin